MKNLFVGRPFVRPLFIWIVGILLHLFFSYHLLIAVALSCSFFLLFLLTNRFSFSKRGVWGMVFCGLMLALSVIVTEYREKERNTVKEPGRIEQLASTHQQALVKQYEMLNLTDAEVSILATLTLGYRQRMTKETRRQFSLTGVSHILAVSGFHVAIVGVFISFFLNVFSYTMFGRWATFLLMIFLLWSFVWISGLAVSAVRAGIMFTLYQTGYVLDRLGDRYNTLAATAFFMLVYNPFFLFDIGFQLSYTAVWFILFLQPRLKRLITLRNPLLKVPWDWLTISIAAQTGTTFLCLYYFGEVSVLFLLTNLPVTAVGTLLIPFGLLWLLLPAWIPGHAYLQPTVEYLTHAMLWIVERFSTFPFATFQMRFDLSVLLIAYLLLFLFLSCLSKVGR